MVARDAPPLTPDSLKRHKIEIADDDHALTCQHRDGRVVRSDVNDGLHVAPLFDFALGGVDNTVHIYHLHGRVDRPETMIAADSEYNRLYRSEGIARTAFDHAYDTLIVGNPILFVGSGLTEADLNRVLRANVSNPDLLRAAPSIVLREAIKPQRELLLEQTQLATKLGVRVVYTGHARRGAAYTLRDHLLLVDYIAWKYDLVERKSADGKPFENPPYRFYTNNTDFGDVDFFKFKQHNFLA
ncbi:SIR2 family protein [Sphingomonas sp. CCH9-H8]|nr:SIR2 family protein [Sphingomonas sp. CCH9-H8]